MEFLNSISFEEFQKCIVQIQDLSVVLQDGWTVQTKSDQENGQYITKKVYLEIEPEMIKLNFEEEKFNEILADPEEAIPVSSKVSILFDYHVVYSISYCCPVLCFNASRPNGEVLTLEECWKVLNLNTFENKYQILTQLPHPILMRPFYTLHPCKTPDLLSVSFQKSKNIVVSWLSVVGPLIGLKLLPDYAKLTF